MRRRHTADRREVIKLPVPGRQPRFRMFADVAFGNAKLLPRTAAFELGRELALAAKCDVAIASCKLSFTGGSVWLRYLCRGFLRFLPMTLMKDYFRIDLATFIAVGMFAAS